MNDNSLHAIMLGGVLVLAVSAVVVRRMPVSTVIGSLLIWGAIGLAVFVGFENRERIDHFFAVMTGNEEQRAEGDTVRIRMARDGHFWARVSLNGHEKRMLVDSGATITALSSETAEAAGIDLNTGRMPATIETANGEVQAVQARVDRLEIGPLRTDDLDIVVSPAFGKLDVIGMNFLSRLRSWRVEGDVLILEPDNAVTVRSAVDEAEDQTSAQVRRNGGDANF